MFATTAASSWTRIAGLALVLVAATVIGLAVGNILTEERGPRTNAGYPIGWNGGARIPVSQTATANFSQSALDAVRVTRGEATLVAPAIDMTDYPLRHPVRATVGTQTDANAESDYHLRHAPASRDDGSSTHRTSGHPQLE